MSQKQRNEQGVAHLLLIVLIVVVVAVAALAGWRIYSSKHKKSGNSTPSSSSSTVSTLTADATCLAKYHDTDLCKFVAASSAQPIDKTGYTATLTVTQNSTTSSINFSQDGKGNSSIASTGGGAEIDSIILNGATYVKNGSTWIRYAASNTPSTTTSPSSDLSFMDSLNNTQFTKIGTEACGSLTCTKYKVTDSTLPNDTQYVWFDTKDYLLREWSASGSDGTTDMKINYQAVNITAPSPVQDFSAAQ